MEQTEHTDIEETTAADIAPVDNKLNLEDEEE